MPASVRERLWEAVREERAALAADLADLDAAQWSAASDCTRWDVREVVAHLTAAASTGWWAWLASMAAARFDTARHNDRRLAEQLGAGPAVTLERFRAVVGSRVAPTGDVPAWLGEVVVHGQDVRRPLGLPRVPPVEVCEVVARFYARRDFTVSGATLSRGLRLDATDGAFEHGPPDGPLVRGTTLALVMVMAGRPAWCDRLLGPGAVVLRGRLTP